MITDLSTWLLEQIHTDRVLAEDAARDWVDGEDGDEMAGQTDSILVGSHLVRWSPARVLAECEASRQIIAEHGPGKWLMDPRPYGREALTCATCGPFWWPSRAGKGDEPVGPIWLDMEPEYRDEDGWVMCWPCRTLRFLALPYADRPGYREEWKP